MKELSLEKMGNLKGGMSFQGGLALTSLGVAALGVGAVTGGAGAIALWMAGTSISKVGFMTSCGPGDF